MMPTDENLYGSWPRCGEIDIMEVLGHEPEKAYGTIHYGNPHREQQGTYILDETTDFENAELKVDYVKVYQLDNYDENVTKPEKEPVDLRDPDATGNYINNGDFSVNEDLTDNEGWIKLTTLGGRGESIIENNKIILTTEEVGSENHSLQLVQPQLPLK